MQYNHHHPADNTPYVATIGFFDGVHRGHQYLISRLMEQAAAAGMPSMVITFDRHPREVLGSNYQPRMLSTLSEKLQRLRQTGVDRCEVLSFTPQLAALTAREFMQHVLKEQLNVGKLYIGYDNRFGHNREEGFDDYVRYGREMGIEVIHNDAFQLNQVNISSSVVRSFLDEGEVELANQCLGYNYTVEGGVVDGVQEGRKMGFPTANIEPSYALKLIPAPGVYAVKVRVGEKLYDGFCNIGFRPTVNSINGSLPLVEVHIFDFDEDIYGKNITIWFAGKLRDETKFDTLPALVAQLKKDKRDAKTVLKKFEG